MCGTVRALGVLLSDLLVAVRGNGSSQVQIAGLIDQTVG
jgi:hypothetical protein